MQGLFGGAGWIADLCKRSITVMSPYFPYFSQVLASISVKPNIARFAPIL
jgi:hypothetical protein